MSLSNRVRPDVEAAPWVVEEIKALERIISDTDAAIKSAVAFLEGDHVARNKFRLGAIGAQDIETTLAIMKGQTEPKKAQCIYCPNCGVLAGTGTPLR